MASPVRHPLLLLVIIVVALLSPLAFANPVLQNAPSRPDVRHIAATAPAVLPRQNDDDASSGSPAATRSSRSSSSTTNTSVPPARVTIADYSYLGCFQDGSNHILTVQSKFDLGMTPELCRNLCLVAECGIFGLRDKYSCLCGRQVEPFAVSARESECSEPCRGDEVAACGASSRMNVYSATVELEEVDRTFLFLFITRISFSFFFFILFYTFNPPCEEKKELRGLTPR